MKKEGLSLLSLLTILALLLDNVLYIGGECQQRSTTTLRISNSTINAGISSRPPTSIHIYVFRLSIISSRLNTSFGPNFSYPTYDYWQNVSRRTSLCTGALAHKSAMALRHRTNGSELGERTSSKITIDEELYDILFAFE